MLSHVTQEGFGYDIAVFPHLLQLQPKPLKHGNVVDQQRLDLAFVDFVEELIC